MCTVCKADLAAEDTAQYTHLPNLSKKMARQQGVITYCWYQGDEELRTVGVGASICHAERVWTIMAETFVEFIFKLAAPNRFSTSAIPCTQKTIKQVIGVIPKQSIYDTNNNMRLETNKKVKY